MQIKSYLPAAFATVMLFLIGALLFGLAITHTLTADSTPFLTTIMLITGSAITVLLSALTIHQTDGKLSDINQRLDEIHTHVAGDNSSPPPGNP